MMISFIRSKRWVLAGVITLLVIWKILSLVMASGQLVPAPEETVAECVRIILSKAFVDNSSATLFRGLAGFLLAFLMALAMGLLAGMKMEIYTFLRPLLVVLRATPVIAFILLLLIWFKTDWVPVIIAVITMFPILYTNISKGIGEVDPSLKEMIQVYKVPLSERIRSLYFPSISAFLYSGISTALGFGWRAIVIGEVLSQPTLGIGSRMREAYAYFEVTKVIGWTLIAIIMSYAFDLMLSKIEKRVLRWKRI